MQKKSVDVIINQWKKGYSVFSKATGMGSGSHEWRPIFENGKVVQIGVYGRGSGWSDQKEDFSSLKESIERIKKEEKRNIFFQ